MPLTRESATVPATILTVPPPPASRPWSPRWVLALIVLLTLVTRLPALLHPRAIDDEQVYAVVAREMLQGGLPYLDAVERKPPLLFVVYAAVLGAAGGDNWFALHLVALGWTLATMGLLYLTARRLFDPGTGLVAAALYGLFQMWGDYRNLAFNGELLMNLPIAAALLLVFREEERRWRPALIAAGGLIALATLLKQPAGIAGVALAAYVLGSPYRTTRGLELGDSLWHAFELALGFCGVLGVAALLLHLAGILPEAIYWSVTNHGEPIGPTTWHYWNKALSNTGYFLAGTAPLALGAAAAAGLLGPRAQAPWYHRAPERRALLVLLLVSLFAVSSNGQFLFHYYLQLLPPLVLLAAPILIGLLRREPPGSRWLPRRGPLLLWLGLTLAAFTIADTVGLLQRRASSAAGAWIRSHSQPTDRILVWGQGVRKTGIYLDAGRRPASRYLSPFPLTGHVFGSYPKAWGPEFENRRIVPGAWDSLQADLAAHPARYIVDAEGVQRHSRYPISRYPWLDSLVARDYRLGVRVPDGIIYERRVP